LVSAIEITIGTICFDKAQLCAAALLAFFIPSLASSRL
jgi:hypothetical protein